MRDSERACQVAERVAEKIRDVTRVAYDAEPACPTQAGSEDTKGTPLGHAET